MSEHSEPSAFAASPDKGPAGPAEVVAALPTNAQPEPEGPEPSTLAARFMRNLWTSNTVTVTLLAIALATVIGAILIIISDPNVRSTYTYFFARPADALTASWNKVVDAYSNLFEGSIVDPQAVQRAINGEVPWERVFFPISETLAYAAPLAFTGLAFAIAFRGGLFNIGGRARPSWERSAQPWPASCFPCRSASTSWSR
jgi:simple sugar transport system permease protein